LISPRKGSKFASLATNPAGSDGVVGRGESGREYERPGFIIFVDAAFSMISLPYTLSLAENGKIARPRAAFSPKMTVQAEK
jgi:hypothetical protein